MLTYASTPKGFDSQPLIKQTTIAAAVETSGLGLHTGVRVHLRLLPAPPDT
ncbi:MAG: UDP-3-O-acyl-N-acetylglucosamine deacetylase, partial [Acidobacteria bacterium]|nr:UDP-3-O-acyl-N-acetylglucosamine deacetylase [Acidobacteriota bacterium]